MSKRREYWEAILIAVIFLKFANTFVLQTFYIPSPSMVDTLLVGDHLFVNRFVFGEPGPLLDSVTPARPVQRGDIVVFRSPEDLKTDLVKRCVGLPGETIQVVSQRVLIDGEPLDESAYVQHSGSASGLRPPDFGPYRIPEGHYFMMGDNRDNSRDSRAWGSLPDHLIKGRAFLIYWSYDGDTPDGKWRGIFAKLRQLGKTAIGFFPKTRWERTFHLIR